MRSIITENDQQAIRAYFGMPLEALTVEAFRRILRALRVKHHPDQFEHLEDPALRDEATKHFQRIEVLAAKIEAYFSGSASVSGASSSSATPDFMHPMAVFAANKLKVEVLTADSDLKFRMLGTRYRWLQYGEYFKIPNTQATIIIDEDHTRRAIGFRETIRMYLTFDQEDAVETIAQWLHGFIAEAPDNSLIIEGERIDTTLESLLTTLRKHTYQRLDTGPDA